MNPLVQGLLLAWRRNGDYAAKLVADLDDEQMTHQPRPRMNHPAWVLKHLGAYHPVIVGLLRGGAVEDPLNHPFGMKSAPEADLAAYGSGKDELAAAFADGHAQVEAALNAADDAVFAQGIPVERWRGPYPTVGSILGYLMLAHEGIHLGQLSAWRRVQGLASV